MSKKISDLTITNSLESTDKVLVETEAGTKIAPVAALRESDAYDGVDLTEVFADEIAEFDSVWAWIADRCKNRNYAGLHVKDYIPWTLNGYTIESQIAGIEPYYHATDVSLGGHIDFISKDCYPERVQYNTSNVNQGSATNPNPYMVSNLKSWLDTLAGKLPTELSNVILNKRSLMESRYTSGSTLTSSTTWAWQDLGKLWVPHETEVFGSLRWSGKYAGGNGVKYPIFNDGRSIVKSYGKDGSRSNWWECDVMDASSTNACLVSVYGYANNLSASNTGISAPVCFRIGYNA